MQLYHIKGLPWQLPCTHDKWDTFFSQYSNMGLYPSRVFLLDIKNSLRTSDLISNNLLSIYYLTSNDLLSRPDLISDNLLRISHLISNNLLGISDLISNNLMSSYNLMSTTWWISLIWYQTTWWVLLSDIQTTCWVNLIICRSPEILLQICDWKLQETGQSVIRRPLPSLQRGLDIRNYEA